VPRLVDQLEEGDLQFTLRFREIETLLARLDRLGNRLAISRPGTVAAPLHLALGTAVGTGVTVQNGEPSAGRVGAKRRIEAKRLVEGAPIGGKRLVYGVTVSRCASPLRSEATLRQAQDGVQPALTLQLVKDLRYGVLLGRYSVSSFHRGLGRHARADAAQDGF
jgi:hypothetical protein